MNTMTSVTTSWANFNPQNQSLSALSVSKLPTSFRTALEQLEDEIVQLAQDVSYCKKEVQILHSEQTAIAQQCNQQQDEAQAYIEHEVGVLNSCIQKQAIRQKAEFSRLNEQVLDVRSFRDELDKERMKSVAKLQKV